MLANGVVSILNIVLYKNNNESHYNLKDPEKVCEFLQMCTPSHSKLIKRGKTVGGTVECNICLYAAQVVDGFLKQNKTVAEITKDIESVCNVFPSPIKDEVIMKHLQSKIIRTL